MTKIIKDGKIDTRTMVEYTYNSNVEQTIIELNKMWNRSGWFSICTITNIMHRFGKSRYFNNTHEQFLSSFHCVDWRNMAPSMPETIAMVTVQYIACKDIGYDCDAKKFVDLRFEGSATRVGPQALPAPNSNVDDTVEVHRSKFRAIISNMFKIFRKKK